MTLVTLRQPIYLSGPNGYGAPTGGSFSVFGASKQTLGRGDRIFEVERVQLPSSGEWSDMKAVVTVNEAIIAATQEV